MSIEAMKQALEAMGSVGADLICENSHHRKKDQHKDGVQCPIEQRWHESYEALRQAIEEAEHQKPVSIKPENIDTKSERVDSVDIERENELDAIDRAYFAGKQAGFAEVIAKLKENV